MSDHQPIHVTADKVLARYGRSNPIWLYRRLRDDPDFPKPLRIANVRYWRLDELDAYDNVARLRPAPVSPRQNIAAA
jgi:predicted DNA-binding transcriptional regulator AlpA